MYPIRKILVCLDLTEADPFLIKFVSYISQTSTPEKIYFASTLKDTKLPEEISKKFPELSAFSAEERENKMKEQVDRYLDSTLLANSVYIVKHGQKAKKILQLSIEEGIDLVIIGRKKGMEGSGVLAQRLARRLQCSLLIIPQGFEPKIETLLVPSDFSDYSEIAMEEAITIAGRQNSGIKIICQNVYHVPAGYHYTGKSYEEFAKIMEKNTEIDYETFIKKIDTKGVDISPVYSLDSNDDPVEDIYEMAHKIHADCIIIGARGRTTATALFLGSMAERLIRQDFEIPLLIVRPKGRNAGIIDYLREEI